MPTMPDAKDIVTLYGVLSIALIFFTFIVASTKHYQSRNAFWLRVLLAWLIAYLLASTLFLFLKLDTILTIMVCSLAGYLIMGDLPFRKKAPDELLEQPSEEKETVNE